MNFEQLIEEITPHKGRKKKHELMLGLKVGMDNDGLLYLYSKFQNKSHNSDWKKQKISYETLKLLYKDVKGDINYEKRVSK